jgi:hypothetical protein
MNKRVSALLFFVCLFLFSEASCLSLKNFLKKDLIGQNFIQEQSVFNSSLDHSIAKLQNCNSDNCHPNNGKCVGNAECVCSDYYAHFPDNSTIACKYERKLKTIAFSIELLIPFGSCHFYLGNYGLGTLKFSILVIIPIVYLVIACLCCKSSNKIGYSKISSFICSILTGVFVLGLIGWLIFDLTKIYRGDYDDKNGIKMK